MNVKYWGVRGSLPASPTPEQWKNNFEVLMHQFFEAGFKEAGDINAFLKQQSVTQVGGFGTATTCAEVFTSKTQIIIDGGTGLHQMSAELMKGPAGKGQAEIHIFMTHFHWDHMLGIPFFAPHFIKGNRIHYYAVQEDLEKIVKIKFTKPMFPVAYDNLPCTLVYHRLEPRKSIQLGELKITPYQLDHPDPCWGYKVECEGQVYAHCVDTEGTRVSEEALGLDLPLYQGVDLMFFDAQYTLPELAEKANWGHSAAQIGLDLAFREKIKNVVFAHHDPGADAQQIFGMEKEIREYYNWKIMSASAKNIDLPKVNWQFAYEGLVVRVPGT